MEQYSVPQFIEADAKIISFLSFKQFFYLVAAGGICFILYYVLPLPLFMLSAVAVVGAAGALAFVQINGMPLLNIMLQSIGFAVGGKNYVWQKKESPYPFKPIARTRIQKITDKTPVLQAQPSQLRRIKTKVDTQNN